MRPMVGLALGERYRLTRRVAVGGMGEVWVADDSFLGRDVAVKVLREEYTGQEDFLKRLRTEARNSAALSHPNIAQMYDYGEQDGTGYLVMELVLGEPLADLLEREPVLPPKKLLPILAATARGLHHAHQAGVVHRDVKPGNILLEHPGRTSVPGRPAVKITDFGVSLAANQAAMTATGMVMGTAQYLSPEQAIGQAATPKSDVYALGVIAYEATAGKRPFTGQTPVDIAVAHVNSPVPPLPTTVHPELSSLIGRLLEKDPAKRPASAGDLADELEDLAREIAADPLGARSRTARRLQAAPAHRRAEAPSAAAGSRASGTRAAVPTRAGGAPGSSGAAGGTSRTRPASAEHGRHAPVPAETPERGTVSDDAAATAHAGDRSARPLPLRREVHGAAATARHDPRRPAAPRGAGGQPGDRAAARRGAAGGGDEAVPRRASTTTGLRLGPLGRLSWPLVALLALLVVLLVATLVRSLTGGNSNGAAGAQPLATPTVTVASAPGRLWDDAP